MWCEVLVSHILRVSILLESSCFRVLCRYVFRIFLPGNMYNKKQKTHGDTFNPLKVPRTYFYDFLLRSFVVFFTYHIVSLFFFIFKHSHTHIQNVG